jgi:hypothetical protein
MSLSNSAQHRCGNLTALKVGCSNYDSVGDHWEGAVEPLINFGRPPPPPSRRKHIIPRTYKSAKALFRSSEPCGVSPGWALSAWIPARPTMGGLASRLKCLHQIQGFAQAAPKTATSQHETPDQARCSMTCPLFQCHLHAAHIPTAVRLLSNEKHDSGHNERGKKRARVA